MLVASAPKSLSPSSYVRSYVPSRLSRETTPLNHFVPLPLYSPSILSPSRKGVDPPPLPRPGEPPPPPPPPSSDRMLVASAPKSLSPSSYVRSYVPSRLSREITPLNHLVPLPLYSASTLSPSRNDVGAPPLPRPGELKPLSRARINSFSTNISFSPSS